MDEQQNEATNETGPDDNEPTPERQAELRKAYEANITVGKPPYAGVVISTRGELDWIIRERGWSRGSFATFEQRIDLRRVGFASVNLSGISLNFADLREAGCDAANFSNADFTTADLRDVVMEGVSFAGASLLGANLSGARFRKLEKPSPANFSNANLSMADLSGAVIHGDLRGANLWRARMDASTVLGANQGEVRIDGKTRLLDVSWNGANLALVRWDEVPRLGDEGAMKEASTRKQRLDAYQETARAYYGLAKALEIQGLTAPALRYRRRQHQLERAAQLRSFNLLGWLFSSALNFVSGYGDRPLRALGVYLAFILAFAGIYFGITTPGSPIFFSGSQPLQVYEAIVFSLSSFHGRGFFPSTFKLGDPVTVVAAIEAVVGLFIELVLIATFTRRLFER